MTPQSKVLAWLICLAAVAATTGCRSGDPRARVGSARDGVFVHLSKGPEDPHAVAMALKMANLMAADRDVIVYCDLKGIYAVLKNADAITFPSFESSHAQIKTLLDKSVPIYACPGCLTALGKTPDDLMPGVRVAEKEPFFAFTKGRILTIDY